MQTQPLRSGDKLPDHPDHTTSLKIIKYGRVTDDADGHECAGGLHATEISMLKGGERGGLAHLYRYAIIDGRIFHTRNLVVVDVECTNANADDQ